eukprot:COSAG01_NODE_2129_length_8368_cov_15.044041_1_plen_172_part_10
MHHRVNRFAAQAAADNMPPPPPPPPPRRTTRYDMLICGGRVIDPANDIDGTYDVAITDGLISRVSPAGGIPEDSAREIVRAAGLLVVPGLIDLHAHGFQFAEPIGIDFDRQCLERGCTTVVCRLCGEYLTERRVSRGGGVFLKRGYLTERWVSRVCGGCLVGRGGGGGGTRG